MEHRHTARPDGGEHARKCEREESLDVHVVMWFPLHSGEASQQ